MVKLLSPANEYDFVDLAPLGSTRFIVTVDTEEEFDWNAPFSKSQRSVDHISHAPAFQSLCEEFGVKPIYLVDHPIASNAKAVSILGEYADRNKASIGLHLHPWVTPPFVEEVNRKNSYSSNLPNELEREKLLTLYDLVSSAFNVKPNIYRAGRYGAGDNSIKILAELGISFDSSVRASFDYSSDSGPNFALEPVNPFWIGGGTQIELPVTTVFGGKLRQFGQGIFDKVSNGTARGILSKTGMLERIAFTPEGIPIDKSLLGIELAIEEGIGILNFSFHSPSLAPGFTPYVRNQDDLDNFYRWWRGVFEYLSRRGVRPISLEQLSDGLIPNNSENADLPLAIQGSNPLFAPHSGL
jgi:hypothetical protein